MKPTNKLTSVFARLQNKLKPKDQTPWYQQTKIVAPLLAVVVIAATVLGVISNQTGLFRGAVVDDYMTFTSNNTTSTLPYELQGRVTLGINALGQNNKVKHLLVYVNGSTVQNYDSTSMYYAKNTFDFSQSIAMLASGDNTVTVRIEYGNLAVSGPVTSGVVQKSLTVQYVLSDDGVAIGSKESIQAGLTGVATCNITNLESFVTNLYVEINASTQITAAEKVTYKNLLTSAYNGCLARTDSAEGGTDRVNPTVSFTSSNRIDAGSTYVLSGVVADNIGVASATVILNNSGVAQPLTLVNRLFTLPGQIPLPNSKLFNYSFDINDLNLGVNTFTVTATDAAGNTTSSPFMVTRMSTATVNRITGVTVTPEMNLMLVGTTRQLTSDVAVSGTPPAYQLEWLSSNPSVATVSNTGLVTSVSVGDATVTVRVVEQPTLSDTAQILVRARQVMPDNNLDIVDPEIAVSPLTATVNEAVYPVVATITDNVGVTEVRLAVNGDLVQPSALVDNVLTQNVTLIEGPNTILITAFDAAGNSAAKTLTITYHPNVVPEPDNVPPVVTIDSAGLTTSVNYVISGRVQDASSALGLATVSVNGGNERSLTLDSTGRFAKTLVLAAGVNSLKVTAFDAEGNEGTATKSVLVSTDSQPDEFAVSVSFDASADYPVNPLRPQLRGTVPFKKVVVNLYRADTNEAIYTVFQHCVVGETGCTTYSNNQYTTPINNLDVTAWAQNNLTDGLYYYKAYAKRGDLAAENFSAQFKYVNAQVQIPPNLPYHPCDYYFTDVPAGVSACNAVALVRELGVFYGNVDQYGQRVFRPNDPLLRTELFAIANRFARLPEVSYNPSADGAMGFSDLKEFVNNPEASWFMTEIKRMRRYGNSVIQGYPDGTLRPLVPILIAENAKVILEAGFVGNVIAAQRPSIDLTKQPWWQDYTTFLASRGVKLSGPGGEVITRSEVAQFFANLYLRGMLR